MSVQLVSFHHRLAHLGGHKYAEVLGLMPAAEARGLELWLLMHEGADAATRRALPLGLAVLHDATFQMELSYDERCADFTSMLSRHVDPLIRKDDWLFVTTCTQCELRGLVHWIGRLDENNRPWVFACFHSDRWNRYGAEERARQVAEFRALATDLARSDRGAKRRLIVGAVTEALCAELRSLLGIPVAPVPMMMPSSPYVPNEPREPGHAVVGFLGGARFEKGGHHVAAVRRELMRSDRVAFLVQLANEQLSVEQFSELCKAAAAPNTTVVHGSLEQSLYRSLVAKADILLLPYDRTSYRNRPSAIFVEAASTGRPVVAPSGTWMADQIGSGRAAGVTYDGDDTQAIVAAVLNATANLPQLLETAKQHSPYWRSKMDAGPVLDWFSGEIENRQKANAGALLSKFRRILQRDRRTV
jgi:hypothetical protein